jgi:hypothetical protein
MDSQKFILCYIANEHSTDFLRDSFKYDDVERGLVFNSKLNKEILNSFVTMKDRGYFPVGIIIDPKSDNTEFLFKRHPEQKDSQKLLESADTKLINL